MPSLLVSLAPYSRGISQIAGVGLRPWRSLLLTPAIETQISGDPAGGVRPRYVAAERKYNTIINTAKPAMYSAVAACLSRTCACWVCAVILTL